MRCVVWQVDLTQANPLGAARLAGRNKLVTGVMVTWVLIWIAQVGFQINWINVRRPGSREAWFEGMDAFASARPPPQCLNVPFPVAACRKHAALDRDARTCSLLEA